MGIPTDVTVRLAVNTATCTVPDSVIGAVTGAFFAFLSGGINGSAVTGKGKSHEVNETVLCGMVKKKHFKDLIELSARFHIVWWFELKLVKEVFDRDFINRGGFFPFFIRFIRFWLWRVDRIRKILIVGKLKPFLKIIKGAGTWSVTDRKTGKDGVKLIFFEVSGPIRIGSDFALHGEEDGTEHIGREPGFRAENRVTVTHDDIYFRKIKSPEIFHDIPGRRRQGINGVWIIFT